MKTFPRLALGAALVLVVAACADPSGQPWTPPPAGSVAPATEAPASVAPASAAPASAAPSAAASVAPSAAPASAAPSAAPSSPVPAGPIALTFTADGQLQRDGAKVTDIAVTPGETAEFMITNESGKPHNFYVGPSQAFLLGQTADLAGIAEWSDAEPKPFTWEVPADITGYKFGSTVGSDFAATSGTFSVAGTATPAPASQAPASAAPSAAASAPATSQEPGGRVIDLVLTAALQFTDPSGVQVKDIPVTPGETIVFKLTNTAGYVHNFWIGPDQALQTNQTSGLVGVPDWADAEPRELTWVVPEDVTSLKYGCTVPGHYMMMNGTFSVAS